MKIAIMQPTFLPWIGYFAMIKKVDCFVFLDHVQFERRSWQSRNKIKLQNKEHFISLSCQKSPQKTALKDIKLDPLKKWRLNLLKTFHHAYSKSVNFQKYFTLLQEQLNSAEFLCELNIALIKQFCKDLNITTPLFYSSNMDLGGVKREDLLLKICQELKADSYLSPEGSKTYLQSEHSLKIFKECGIAIEYFEFQHPIYKQIGNDFILSLSVIDFLVNCAKPNLVFERIFQTQRTFQ